ncbi:MAG: alanine racemase [Verrucomicrobiota bacterium]|nr:alanine racemase [Verrucomicrobiota bacterium]
MSNTWVELDCAALEGNLRALREALRPKTEIIFVVKANAYGHGMIEVSRCAWTRGARWFAVAHVDEGVALRKALPRAQIILLGAAHPSEAPLILRNRLVPIIVNERHARSLAAAARATGRIAVLECHAKVDTGMGRLGFAWLEAGRLLPELARLPGLRITGLCSHLAAASGFDKTFSRQQIERFHLVVEACKVGGLAIPFQHVSNSGGILQDRAWDLSAVRAGILLYGYARKEAESCRARTRPFLHWKTRVLQVKEVPAGFPISYDRTYVSRRPTRIATIDAGYSDGISRLLSNKGCVLIGGRRCPIAGRVTMNLVAVDLGPRHNAREWDEVVLIGTQGRESIWANEIAGWRRTIAYEVLTDIRAEDRRVV